MIPIDICSLNVETNPCSVSAHRLNALILLGLKNWACTDLNFEFVSQLVTEAAYPVPDGMSGLLIDCSANPVAITLNPGVLPFNVLLFQVFAGNPLANTVTIQNTAGDIYNQGTVNPIYQFQALGEGGLMIALGNDLYRIL